MSFQAPPHVNLNDDKSQLAIRSIIACSLLAGFAVLGRFLSRRLVKADLWATDFLIVFGLIGAWALSALNVWGKMRALPHFHLLIWHPDAKLGVGRHIWVVPPQNLTPLLKVFAPGLVAPVSNFDWIIDVFRRGNLLRCEPTAGQGLNPPSLLRPFPRQNFRTLCLHRRSFRRRLGNSCSNDSDIHLQTNPWLLGT